MSERVHPCLSCGACCAFYRASFYWAEAEHLPEALWVRISPFLAAMAGTERNPPRCNCLSGEIGRRVACTIHPVRPSPCREFPPSLEDGTPNPRCDQARALHGLPPLTPADWEQALDPA